LNSVPLSAFAATERAGSTSASAHRKNIQMGKMLRWGFAVFEDSIVFHVLAT
jgi:hypothetical protein